MQMRELRVSRHTFLMWVLTGFALVNMALFLHPMSPEDFLEFALSNPIATVFDAQGGLMAAVFWCGILLFLAGIAGLLERMSARRHAGAQAHRLSSVGVIH
jgi:hypothetical protein